jgi:hypothetical protein
MDHRGRLQAQGGGIEESEAWSEEDALTEIRGHELLTRLKYRLAKDEYLLRQEAFQKAHRFIDNAAKNGGVGPMKQSWPQPPRRDCRRVDIEVQSGRAFVKDG